MSEVEIADAGPGRRTAVAALLERVESTQGHQPLSDQSMLDFTSGAASASVVALDPVAGAVVGYAQASTANDISTVELVLDADSAADRQAVAHDLVAALIDRMPNDGPDKVNWWIRDPSPADRELTGSLGFGVGRTLLQMRRPLPVGEALTITTRSFVVGTDEPAWVEVNNRAFADHEEQGGWSVAAIEQREAEPWFDADGFRLHEIDGRLAGFCWTKVHPPTATDPRLGEIYVIGVDPDFHGRGLGLQLTLAGLDHLAGIGVGTGMLWVDDGNLPAVGLYRRLDFETHTTNVAFTRDLSAT